MKKPRRAIKTMKTKTTKTKQKIGNNFVNVPGAAPKKLKSYKVTPPARNPLLAGLIREDNKTLTDNGAATLKSTLNSLVDLFAMGAALRTRADSEVISLFTKSFAEEPLLSIKLLFHIRNIRGGQGERKTFRTILKYLGDNYPDLTIKNFDNILHFGRADDLFSLFNTKVEPYVLQYIRERLNIDVLAYEKNELITTLAKWLPSENTSSAATRQLAYKIRNYLGWSSKQYRKTLSALRSYSNVVEVKMSDNKWKEINYQSVPSKANLNYRKAFSKHDPEGYVKFIEQVKKGEKKINSAALFPYEIVEKIMSGAKEETLDVLWSSLPNYLEDNDRNILCVCDVSGSMNGRPMSTSISLGIYTCERNKGPFNGYFITFSENPQLQKLAGNNIREKVNNLSRADWGMSTNIQSVFNLVLNKAIETNCKQSDMPAQILIISDMEFNRCGRNTNLEVIKQKYLDAGYKMPSLVFWNVNSTKNNCPAEADEKGVLLVSGSSPSIFKTLLAGISHTPLDQVLETLNDKMYERVVI